ncbi:MAG: hypothetical protein AB7N65_20175 [Vicinamibacterales bacterium]
MPLIPRQVKPPARIAITCKVPEAVAALLKHYAEFLESSQEHVVTETLRLAFRRDKEFQTWLAATHPEAHLVDRPAGEASPEPPHETIPSQGRGRS